MKGFAVLSVAVYLYFIPKLIQVIINPFVIHIHPLAKNMAEIDSTNGYDKVASLTQTLAKMAMLKSGNVEDVTPQEPLV